MAGAAFALESVAGIIEAVQAHDCAGNSLAGAGDVLGTPQDEVVVGLPCGGPSGYACSVKAQTLAVAVPQLLSGPPVKGSSAVGMVGWAVAGGGDLGDTADLDFVVSGWATAQSANAAGAWLF